MSSSTPPLVWPKWTKLQVGKHTETSDEWQIHSTEKYSAHEGTDTHSSHSALLTWVTSRTLDHVLEHQKHTPAGGQTTRTAGIDTHAAVQSVISKESTYDLEGQAWRASNVSWLAPADCVYIVLVCDSYCLYSNMYASGCVFLSAIKCPPPFSATYRHGNYGPKLAQYFSEWPFPLSSISATSTHSLLMHLVFSNYSHFRFPSFASLMPRHAFVFDVPSFVIYQNSQTKIITK